MQCNNPIQDKSYGGSTSSKSCGQCYADLRDENVLRSMTSLAVSRALVKAINTDTVRIMIGYTRRARYMMEILEKSEASYRSSETSSDSCDTLSTDDHGVLSSDGYDDKLLEVKIYCSKSIVVTSNYKVGTLTLNSIKNFYTRVINEWYAFHVTTSHLQSTRELLLAAKVIHEAKTITKLVTYALDTERLIKELSVCNGNNTCTDIITTKDISRCTFDIANMEMVCRLDGIGLAIILTNIAEHAIKLTNDRQSYNAFDMERATITCGGVLTTHLIIIENTTTFIWLREIFIKYCTAWINANKYTHKQSDLDKIRVCRVCVKVAKTIEDIAKRASELYDSL